MSLMKKNSNKNQQPEKKKKNLNQESENESGLSILDVDLIKGEKDEKINWRKYISFIFLAVIASSVLALEVYWLIGWWEFRENKQARKIEEEVKQVQVQVGELESSYKNLTDIKERVDIVHNLLDNHPYWTNFFNFLEERTLSSVFWDSFSGDLSGSYSLRGETDTYSEINWQTSVFLDSEFVNSAQSGNTENVENNKIEFDFDFEINKNLFY